MLNVLIKWYFFKRFGWGRYGSGKNETYYLYIDLVDYNSKREQKYEIKYIEDILEADVDSSFYFDTEKINAFLDSLDIKDNAKHESRIIKLFDLPIV